MGMLGEAKNRFDKEGIFISKDCFDRIQKDIQSIERDFSMKNIATDVLPIHEVEPHEVADEDVDDRLLEYQVKKMEKGEGGGLIKQPPDDFMIATGMQNKRNCRFDLDVREDNFNLFVVAMWLFMIYYKQLN